MSRRPRIALVEDEPDLARALAYKLEAEGFDVVTYDRGDRALSEIPAAPPDLVLLDLMLPEVDGFEVCRTLKALPRTKELPIIMLTARSEETDRIVGLELGADDYITKPFSPREVVLRIRAVLRRAEGRSAPPAVLRAGPIELDREAHEVRVDARPLALTATEFKLLAFLMERAGRVQSRETLLQQVWGYAEHVDSRTVDTHIRRLRRKLGAAAERIETIIGVGYRLSR